ncbi:MAG: hypothetical protein Q7J03_06910 [Methanoregula sp.]|nr:hypothetical protein [Methanoregula sp.]
MAYDGEECLIAVNVAGVDEKSRHYLLNRQYRVILSITGITLRETDEPVIGSRFGITVPKGM